MAAVCGLTLKKFSTIVLLCFNIIITMKIIMMMIITITLPRWPRNNGLTFGGEGGGRGHRNVLRADEVLFSLD